MKPAELAQWKKCVKGKKYDEQVEADLTLAGRLGANRGPMVRQRAPDGRPETATIGARSEGAGQGSRPGGEGRTALANLQGDDKGRGIRVLIGESAWLSFLRLVIAKRLHRGSQSPCCLVPSPAV